MEPKKLIKIGVRLTEAIIEILKEELNGKELKRNENQQKKGNRNRKAGR
ncbi:MAG: hypothetical protein RBT56_08610 [Ignavibacteriaceae bacterium]|jgi:hypothetical protein|nr:hypothetical protein [Ignavibacteriaceae bacterium]